MRILAMHVPRSKRGAPGGAIDFLAQSLESQSAVPESICASMTDHPGPIPRKTFYRACLSARC